MGTNKFAQPIIIDGRKLLGINRYYNGLIDFLRSDIAIKKNLINAGYNEYELNINNNQYILNKLLYEKERKNRDYMHKASKKIIDYAIENNVKEIIIGYNTNWKKRSKLGRKTNRKFQEIAYRNLLNMIFYKGKDAGIHVSETDEAYTSKCDALCFESIKKHEKYSGTRISRGQYKSGTGIYLNADINAYLNILRKKNIKNINKKLLTKTKIKILQQPKRIQIIDRKRDSLRLNKNIEIAHV